jgi:hypothetical protein
MQPTELHETIAYQIDNMRPPHLEPGKHIGLEVIDETRSAWSSCRPV